MRIVEKIAGIEGVAVGGEAIIKLPVNRRYHWIKCYVAGTANSVALSADKLVTTIRQYVSTKLTRDTDATFCRWLPQFNGLSAPASNVIPLYYSEPWRATVMDEQASAWDVFGETEFTIKVAFAATDGESTPHEITGLTFYAYACYDGGQATITKNGQTAVVRNIVKQLPTFVNAAGGQHDVTQIPTANPIQRLYIKGVTPTRVEVIADGFKVKEQTPDELTEELKDYGFNNAVSGAPVTFVAVFDPAQQLFDALAVQRDLVVRVYSDAGGQMPMIVESRHGSY